MNQLQITPYLTLTSAVFSRDIHCKEPEGNDSYVFVQVRLTETTRLLRYKHAKERYFIAVLIDTTLLAFAAPL